MFKSPWGQWVNNKSCPSNWIKRYILNESCVILLWIEFKWHRHNIARFPIHSIQACRWPKRLCVRKLIFSHIDINLVSLELRYHLGWNKILKLSTLPTYRMSHVLHETECIVHYIALFIALEAPRNISRLWGHWRQASRWPVFLFIIEMKCLICTSNM